MRKKSSLMLVSLILVSQLCGCYNYNEKGAEELNKLRAYRNLSKDTKKDDVDNMRYMALRNTAASLGARAGLAWRCAQINQSLAKHSKYLDRIFNFQPLILNDNILPPVLIEGRNTLTQDNDNTLRVSDRSYVILTQAKFITTVPHWRDYLWSNYQDPELPDKTLLPRNAEEIEIWDYYVQDGWIAGVTQGDNIFSENLARVKRDLQGMILYKTLLAKNIVSAPFVAKVDLGVTGDSSKLTVNDKILRITVLPELNADPNEWQTRLTK